MTAFKEELSARSKEVVRPREGACGICYVAAEEICRAKGRIVAYERPDGILARIFDDRETSSARVSAWSGRPLCSQQ